MSNPILQMMMNNGVAKGPLAKGPLQMITCPHHPAIAMPSRIHVRERPVSAPCR